jgi:hypothetical protein
MNISIRISPKILRRVLWKHNSGELLEKITIALA